MQTMQIIARVIFGKQNEKWLFKLTVQSNKRVSAPVQA